MSQELEDRVGDLRTFYRSWIFDSQIHEKAIKDIRMLLDFIDALERTLELKEQELDAQIKLQQDFARALREATMGVGSSYKTGINLGYTRCITNIIEAVKQYDKEQHTTDGFFTAIVNAIEEHAPWREAK